MKYPQARLLVFCKAPQAGKVKTRLAKDIGESAAKKIHEYLARRCIRQLLDFDVAQIELWCAPDTDHVFFQELHQSTGIPLHKQIGDDLGQRMQYALKETLVKNSPVAVVGTDCPVFTEDYLHAVFAAANQNKTVIAPAEDGGYVLLGMNELQPEIFSGMPWGTSQVFSETLDRLTEEPEVLEPLWDVDYVADLRRLHIAANDLKLDEDFQAYLESLNFE